MANGDSNSDAKALDDLLVLEGDAGELGSLDLPASEGATRGFPVRAVVLVVLLLGVGYGFLNGAIPAWLSGVRDSVGSSLEQMPDGSALLSHEVNPIDLRITVLESGTVESASSINVLSEVEGQAAIIDLIAEGESVSAGDVVVELESSGLRTRRTEQQIVVEKARAAHSQAMQENVVAESQAESDINSAALGLEFAKLDLRKYLEGDYPLELSSLQTETALAEEQLERALVQLQFSEELSEDGYLSAGELEADKFLVIQARFKVEMSKEKERLLEEYNYPRRNRDLESKVAEAERALGRVRTLAKASVEQARTNYSAQDATLKLEESKLARIVDQIEKCVMLAPQDGIVVFPTPEDEDLVELFIKQGTMVRERQHVFSIPDTDVLRVSTRVHEAMVNRVRPGLPARIWIDVYPDAELRGEVEMVSPLPEPEDWRKSTVKFYETHVKLLDDFEGLRPGMSAKVEILVDQQMDVLAAPVQAVVQRGPVGFAYVLGGGEPELRRLLVGKSNSEYIAVLDGLSAGERIVLSPDLLGIPADLLERESTFTWGDAELVPESEVPLEDTLTETEFEGVLLGTGNAMAEAEFEYKTAPDGQVSGMEFEITVRGGEPESTQEVTVDGVVIGEITLDVLGAGSVSWSTKDGTFPANFPTIIDGSSVSVGTDIKGDVSR